MPSLFDMGSGGAMSPWWMSGGGPLTYRPSLDWFVYGNQGAPGMDPSMGAAGPLAPPAPQPNMPPPGAPQVPPIPMPPVPPPAPGGGVLSPPVMPPVLPPMPPVMPMPGGTGNGAAGLGGGGMPPGVGGMGIGKGAGEKGMAKPGALGRY